MAALTGPRNTPEMWPGALAHPLAATTTVWQGGIGMLEGGYLVPGKTGTGLIVVGRIEQSATAVAAGDETVPVKPGIYPWDNSTGADLIAQDDVGKTCYVVDDHTVALTNGTNTRSAAGRIVKVDDAGVWVDTRPNA